MQESELITSQLACKRGERLLFSQLDITLGPGDALHIRGPNGIGKSSLLRIMAGLLRPFAGEVTRKGSIGLMDERPALDEQAELGKALGFWQQVDGCHNPSGPMMVMELDDLTSVPVRYLSTGQRKRAAFVRLLNQAPAIWLLDEPFNGLDEMARAKLASMIQLHCGGGGIAVVASHQPIEVAGMQELALGDYVPANLTPEDAESGRAESGLNAGSADEQ